MFDLIGMVDERRDLLKIKVDVVSACALHPVIRDDVLAQAKPL